MTRNTNRQDETPRPLEVSCPQCHKKVAWVEESLYRPFCSKRCKLLDLGAWADGSHRIAGEPAMDETEIDEMILRAERGDLSFQNPGSQSPGRED